MSLNSAPHNRSYMDTPNHLRALEAACEGRALARTGGFPLPSMDSAAIRAAETRTKQLTPSAQGGAYI